MNQDWTYTDLVESFNNQKLVFHKEYGVIQQQLSSLANKVDMPLIRFVQAIRNMALMTPYADLCPDCGKQDLYNLTWPYRVSRRASDGWLTCHYWCPHHQRFWQCGYSVSYPESV